MKISSLSSRRSSLPAVLSVRQTESLAKDFISSSGKVVASKSSITEDEERRIISAAPSVLSSGVKVAKAGRGKIEIHFSSLEELDRLRRLLAADSLHR